MSEKSKEPETKAKGAVKPHEDSWVWTHYDDGMIPPKKPMPAPLRANVTGENPLVVDVYWSMRSPYSYLALDRLLYLQSNYNVDLTFRIIFPQAVRNPSLLEGGLWYRWPYCITDTKMVAKYQGIPYRWPLVDPIVQDNRHFPDCSMKVAPMEEQPYIQGLVRLAAAAQLQGKSPAFQHNVMRIIWDGSNEDWQPHLEAAVEAADMDYKATLKDIEENPDKYDAIHEQNAKDQQLTGHGGVPLFTLREVGEPFFGGDRFDMFFWRLMQNGLTARKEPVGPFVPKPLRWPVG